MAAWDSISARYNWYFGEEQRAKREEKDLEGFRGRGSRKNLGSLFEG